MTEPKEKSCINNKNRLYYHIFIINFIIFVMLSIDQRKIHAQEVINLLETATCKMEQPMSCKIIELYGRDPFLILISCLLSLRARDQQTFEVSKKLFEFARTPQEILSIDIKTLEKILYSLGFYKRKAEILHSVCKELIKKFDGQVPNSFDKLISIKSVGRKTANLVLGYGFGIPAICVDIHVHRISNRLGLVETNNPTHTEKELEKIIPKDKWIDLNRLFVIWGQNICVPVSPFCSRCILYDICPQIGVTKRR